MAPLTIFTHIPKTSGSSFACRLIHANVDESRILENPRFRSFRRLLTEQHLFVTGHLAYGLHWLTTRPCQYITFLRDPIERAISNYYFIRQCDPTLARHRLHEEAQTYTLKGFYQQRHLQNEMTKIIAGFPLWRLHTALPVAAMDRLLLQKAKDHLSQRYVCLGLQEQFETSVLLMKTHFGWTREADLKRRLKKSRKRPSVEELDASTIDVLREAHQLDLELHAHARQLFEQQLAVHGLSDHAARQPSIHAA